MKVPVRVGRRAVAFVAWLALARPEGAHAQSFAPAAPLGPQPGAAALLERALPDRGGWEAGTSVTRWLGERSLETRAAMVLLAPGSVRGALGFSQTGDPELGWTAAGAAIGACSPEGGFAVRAVARRDRSVGALGAAGLRDPIGIEAGAGAWLAAASALTLWACAPQLRTAGPTAPLSRPLQLGARLQASGGAAWVALDAPRGGDDGERAAGLSLGTESASIWAEARDGPLRASAGVHAELRALVIEARVDAHPVLGETTRLGVAWRLHDGDRGR